jgi:hypothetical protein
MCFARSASPTIAAHKRAAALQAETRLDAAGAAAGARVVATWSASPGIIPAPWRGRCLEVIEHAAEIRPTGIAQ